jgi:polysaccharide deacetylase family protein (PEP-CTERM system associated)
VNGISVDLEDWFQVANRAGAIDRADWEQLGDRIERNCDRLLALFDDAAIKATFFVPGSLAKRRSELLGRIAAQGHELASHGWDHARVFMLDRAQFAEDLRRTRVAIEDAAGVSVTGFRAPSFSIDYRTPWAYRELAEQGYTYSSSVIPGWHQPWAWHDAPRFAFRPLPWSGLVELPLTTAQFAGSHLVAGCGFFRARPYAIARWAARQVNRSEHRPAVFFLHPWEVDPMQLRRNERRLSAARGGAASIDSGVDPLVGVLKEFAWGRLDLLALREAPRALELAA